MGSHCLLWHTPVSFHLWVWSIQGPHTGDWPISLSLSRSVHSRCQNAEHCCVSTKYSAHPLSADEHWDCSAKCQFDSSFVELLGHMVILGMFWELPYCSPGAIPLHISPSGHKQVLKFLQIFPNSGYFHFFFCFPDWYWSGTSLFCFCFAALKIKPRTLQVLYQWVTSLVPGGWCPRTQCRKPRDVLRAHMGPSLAEHYGSGN